jgi:hypothetical protein
MGLFGKKKQQSIISEQKCSTEGCSFSCDDVVTMKKHTDWKHPILGKAK